MFNRKKSAYADRVFISPREIFGTTLTLIDFERWKYEDKPRGALIVKELPTGKISCSGTMCRQLDEVDKLELPAKIRIEEYEQKTYKPGQHKAIRIVDAE